MRQTLSAGLVVALSAVAFVGLDSMAASAESTASVVSADARAAAAALKAPKVRVMKVTATSSPSVAGTTVRSTVVVKNTASVRKPAQTVRLYLTDGDEKFKLGEARVKSLASGASTTVRATRTASLKATAGRYSVVACRGPWAVQNCRTSAASVTIEPARLVAAPSSLSLGDVPVGSTSAPRVVTFTNRGHATTGSLSASIPGDSSYSVTSSTCRASLVPGASCTVSVGFAPGSPGGVISTLRVSGTRVAPVTVALTANGTGAALTISESTYAFDDTVVGSASAPVELVVTNTGNVPTGDLEVSLSPDASEDYTVTATSCEESLASAASCTVAVAFTPTAAGERTAALKVSSEPGGSVVTDLAGTGLAPASLSSAPEALAFGDELIGGTTGTQTVTVTNDGDVASGALSVALDGEEAGEFTIVDSDCASALAARASCEVEVAFAPSVRGVASGRIAVTGGPGQVTYAALGGVGQAEAELSISATTYDFGFTDSPTEKVFTVTNDGDAVTGDPDLAVDGSSDFSITTNTCTVRLPGGASCTVGVTYTGSGTTGQSAEIAVTAEPGGTVTADLTGFPLALTIDPASHDYEGVPVGDSSDAVSFTLTNHRLSAVQVSSETVIGPFAVDTSCLAEVLPAGGSCTFSVRFAPTGAGSQSGYVSYTAQGQSARVEVSGTGLTPAAFSLSSSTVDFGAWAPGDVGTQEVTITNTGNLASDEVGFSITGADAGQFTTDDSDCPATLAGGASCVVTVQFLPTTLGDKTATLTVDGATGGTAALTALGAPEGVAMYPAVYDFGTHTVGSSTIHVFRVVNTGTSPKNINSVSSGTPYSLDIPGDFTCVLSILEIQPHRWCTISIAFRPTSAGSFDRMLTAGGDFTATAQMLGTSVPVDSSSSRTTSKSATQQPTAVRLRDGKAVVSNQ